ncbi:hypothetical protein KJ836_01180 [Patescibacteria group bacterium]|nr:hypothetical protein [Patescibacteria group bacterium]
MKNWGLVVVLVLIVSAGLWLWQYRHPDKICQYSSTDNTTEDICVYGAKEAMVVKSPLELTGEARGTWFFEASFPVEIIDGNSNLLAQGLAQSHGDWMTENLVPFTVTGLKFELPLTDTGTLVLKKDNPSGLPTNDASFTIPIRFK